jgi:hypothetical protein
MNNWVIFPLKELALWWMDLLQNNACYTYGPRDKRWECQFSPVVSKFISQFTPG